MPDVLVVDDEPTVCRTLARLFRCEGHDAACATGGEEALRLLGANGHGTGMPRLIVLDVMMPGTDGMEVLTRVRSDERTAQIPVVMYSAVDDEETRRRAMQLGAQGYVAKAGGFEPLYRHVEPFLRADQG
jgi:CheY-like chemotaxis protein